MKKDLRSLAFSGISPFSMTIGGFAFPFKYWLGFIVNAFDFEGGRECQNKENGLCYRKTEIMWQLQSCYIRGHDDVTYSSMFKACKCIVLYLLN